MKKTITKLALLLGIGTSMFSQAQSTVTFDTFTLSTNSFYQDNAGTDWQSGNSIFRYDWNSSWAYWSGGTAYTNVNDTVDGSYTNLYGSITGVAFSGNNYATVQDRAIIAFTNSTTAVQGFYFTNTTYAWKVIKNGNGFSRKFGDTTGTYQGDTVAQGEVRDWFRVSVIGYQNGVKKNDSAVFYLADYRANGTINDYAVKNWQYVNCSSIGTVDSIQFVMSSSDTSGTWMNTPAFFAMDNFTTMSTVGMEELESISNFNLYPNPTNGNINISYESTITNKLTIALFDINGREISRSTQTNTAGSNHLNVSTENLENGVYFIELSNGQSNKKVKFIKL